MNGTTVILFMLMMSDIIFTIWIVKLNERLDDAQENLRDITKGLVDFAEKHNGLADTVHELDQKHNSLAKTMDKAQKDLYDTVVAIINERDGGFGSTGK